jgi:hypothetical protein
VLRWILGRWWTNADLGRFAALLLAGGEEEAVTTAAALLVQAGRSHVDRGDAAPQVPAASTERRLLTLGILLTEIYQFGRSKNLSAEQRERWRALIIDLREDVTRTATTPKDARVLRRGVRPDDTTLVALIRSSAQRPVADELSRQGDALLRRYFRPLVRRQRDVAADGLPYLAPLVVNDLGQTGSSSAQILAFSTIFEPASDTMSSRTPSRTHSTSSIVLARWCSSRSRLLRRRTSTIKRCSKR